MYSPDSKFETLQRWAGPNHRILLSNNKGNVPPRHPVVLDGVEVNYLLGLLGTCQSIREEAISLLKKNLKGTFKVVAPTNFRRIPQIVLELVDRVTFSPLVPIYSRVQYMHRFKNATTLIRDALVLSNTRLLRNWPGAPHGHAGTATINAILKARIASWTSQDIYGNTNLRELATKYNPGGRELFSGECPVAVIVQLYVLDINQTYPAAPHQGLLVTLDYNRGRVLSIKEKRFARRPDSEVSDQNERVWFSPYAWEVVD